MSAGSPYGSAKRRVSYFYDGEIGNYHYGIGHPMKPHRVRMTHNLVVNYGLYRQMEVLRPSIIAEGELTHFHADDYVNFLKIISPDNMLEFTRQLQRFNVGEDCPVFDGLYEYCLLYTSASIAGAQHLNASKSDISINWSGGLHHAKKSEASGFCYINDCVLAILELLKKHQRVLYVDIDIHHGDGVEEAFYSTNRVMTVSFHKFGQYFPGTGDINDTGINEGRGYSVNCPLLAGMNDESFQYIFQPVISDVMDIYQPSAIVLQCGADSLSGDRLGCFNLSIAGHAKCLEYMKTFQLPILLLGGGGYSLRNVSRCWALETATAIGVEIHNNLPYNDYFEYFGPDYKLHTPVSNMQNLNSLDYLDGIMNQVHDGLKNLESSPGIGLTAMAPANEYKVGGDGGQMQEDYD